LHEDEACDEGEVSHELRERLHRDHVLLLFPSSALLCNVLLYHQHNLLFVVGNLEAQQLEALDALGLALVLRADVISGLKLAGTLLKILIVIVLHGIRLSHTCIPRDFQVLVDRPTDAGVSPATVREGVLPHRVVLLYNRDIGHNKLTLKGALADRALDLELRGLLPLLLGCILVKTLLKCPLST